MRTGAVAVQVLTRRGREVVKVEHVGSAHSDAELELLLHAARERLDPGRFAFDLGDLEQVPASVDGVADWTGRGTRRAGERAGSGRRSPVVGGGKVVSTAALLLWRLLSDVYDRLGFDRLGDDTFKALVLARIIEPGSCHLGLISWVERPGARSFRGSWCARYALIARI